MRLTRALRVVVMLALAPLSARAQQPSAQVSVPITITVRPTLAIRSLVSAPATVDASGRLTSTAVVNVESNLPYRLTVRLARSAGGIAPALVRGAAGTFEPLAPGASIRTVASRAGGKRGHEIVCRSESASAESAPCVLIYELAAERDDMLLRSVAGGG